MIVAVLNAPREMGLFKTTLVPVTFTVVLPPFIIPTVVVPRVVIVRVSVPRLVVLPAPV